MKPASTLFRSLMFIGAILFSSCGRNSEQPTLPGSSGEDSTTVDTPVNLADPVEADSETPTVDVAVYVEYPEGIDGCACYFGRTAAELGDGKYIFMTNYEKKAYMELDGQMRVFELIGSADLEDGKLMETWKNLNYNIIVESKETGQIDETWQRTGKISIKPKNKAATVIDVVGECGC